MNRIIRVFIAILLVVTMSSGVIFAADQTEEEASQPAGNEAAEDVSQPAVEEASEEEAISQPAVDEAAEEASQPAGDETAEEEASQPEGDEPEKKETKPGTGVYRKNGYYYYRNPKTGKKRKTAGFIKWNGNRYYVQKGGKIITSKTFRVGRYRYRARKDGRIAVGVYRWGKKRKLYYSDPKNGRWVTIKSHRCQKGVKWKGNWYYLQTNSEVAVNRPVVIKNRQYVADSEGVCTKIKENSTKDPVLKVARKQLGKHTKSQVSKYWTWYYGSRFINTDATPWCGTFVGWCYRKAGRYGKIRSVGNKGYVPSYSGFASSRGKWVKKSRAKEGDIIVFGRNRHVGIVDRVYKGYIYTIEGNSGPAAEIGTGLPGAVTRRVYKLTDPDIKGVIHP